MWRKSAEVWRRFQILRNKPFLVRRGRQTPHPIPTTSYKNRGWLNKKTRSFSGFFLAAELSANFSESSFSFGAEISGFFLAAELQILRFGFFLATLNIPASAGAAA